MPATTSKRQSKSSAGTTRKSDPSSASVSREVRDYLGKYGDKLSKSTQRAKWIDDPEGAPDRAGQTLATRSREVIERWAEERNARPVTAGRRANEDPRVLRFAFGDQGNDRLEDIDWDTWFRVFEDRKLAFLYQETLRSGQQSNFFRLDSPEREDG